LGSNLRVVICGGGNAAHVLVPTLKRVGGTWVGVLAPYGEEAARLAAGCADGGIAAAYDSGECIARPDMVSASPESIVPLADIIILAVPAFAHNSLVELVAPFLKEGAWLGAMPSRSGLEFYAGKPELRARQVTLFGFQTLPWACRIVEYGRRVAVLGTKAVVTLGSCPAGHAPGIAATMEELLGVTTRPVKSMLSMSLGNVGQIIHPGIMYGLFKEAASTDYDESSVPLFYQSVTDEMAAALDAMSNEVLEIAEKLQRVSGERLDLGEVISLRQWLLDSYSQQIKDQTDTRSCLVSNEAYRGLKAPMVRSGSKYRPDFNSRYITEDVPYGLVVTRGMADLCGVPVPTIDDVLLTTSRWLGVEYYSAGKPTGRDIRNSRHPGNFGIHDLEALIRSGR